MERADEEILTMGRGSAPATSYWLGTWFTQAGAQFIVDYLTLTRLR